MCLSLPPKCLSPVLPTPTFLFPVSTDKPWPFTESPINYYYLFIHITSTEEYCKVLKSEPIWFCSWPQGAKPNRFLLHLNILTNSFYPPKYSSSKNTQISISGQFTQHSGTQDILILKRPDSVSLKLGKKTKTGVCFLCPTNDYLDLVLCVFFLIATVRELH